MDGVRPSVVPGAASFRTVSGLVGLRTEMDTPPPPPFGVVGAVVVPDLLRPGSRGVIGGAPGEDAAAEEEDEVGGLLPRCIVSTDGRFGAGRRPAVVEEEDLRGGAPGLAGAGGGGGSIVKESLGIGEARR